MDFESLLLASTPLSISTSSRGWEVILWSGSIGYSTYGVGHGLTPSEALAMAQNDLSLSPHSLDCNTLKLTSTQLNLLFAKPSVPLDFKKRI